MTTRRPLAVHLRRMALAVIAVIAVIAIIAGSMVGVAASAAEGMKIALICAGSTSDGGWNQLAKDAMEAVKKQLGAQVSVIEKVSQDKAGDELRDYAADHYDLVIAHGYEFLNPAAEVAKSGAKTRIAVSGADVEKPGIVTIDFDLSQASYQVGMIAAKLSKSGKLGFIGGSPIPSVKACYRGFLAGARSVRADATVAEAYTSWDQPEQSKAQAEAFFKEGIDAVFHDVDAASRGIFEAVREHNQQAANRAAPVYVFGSCADQNANPVCADFTPASAVTRLDATFLRVAKSVQAGTFKPGVERENLAAGTCVIALNPKLVGTLISAELQAAITDAGAKLASGAIKIPEK